MKSIFLLLNLLLCSLALGQTPAANDLRIPQRDSTNVINLMRNLSFPGSGANAFILMNGATVLPEVCLFSSEFSFTSNVLSISALPQARVSNLVSDMAGKEATIPAGTSAQYYRGDKTWAAMPILVSTFTNDVAYVTSFALTTALGSYVTSSSLTTTLSSYATTSSLTSGLATKFNSPAGTTAQYIRGDGSLATFPSVGTGTVTSVTAGTGLSGGTFTTTGTVSMPNVGTAGTYNGSFTTDAQGRVSAANNLAINDSPGRSIVTTTSSTGFQVDASRAAELRYDVRMSTTASIAGNATIFVYLETANTNSTTPGDWTTIAEVSNSQALSLAITLQSIQGQTMPLVRTVAGGKYVRIRSVTTGTGSASIAYAQEVKH